MFGYVLPGLRDVRGPLVVGALWGWALWLWVGPSILTNPSVFDFLARYGLDALPSPITLTVLVLLAYTLGSLLMIRSSPFHWFGSALWRWKRGLTELNDPTEPNGRLKRWLQKLWGSELPGVLWLRNQLDEENLAAASIDSHLRAQHEKYVARGRFPITNNFGPGCFDADPGLRGSYSALELENFFNTAEGGWELRENLVQAFIRQVKKDELAVEVRIQMRFPDVYNEIDRLRAEGQLRVSIFWPSLLAILSQALLWTLWTLLAIIPLIGLVIDGKRRLTQAQEKTWSCLIAGEVSSPLLDEINAANQLDPAGIQELEGLYFDPDAVQPDEEPLRG